MLEKIKGLAGSLRFWILTLTLIISELQLIDNSATSFNFIDAISYVKVYLIAIAAMRTADKASLAVAKAIGVK